MSKPAATGSSRGDANLSTSVPSGTPTAGVRGVAARFTLAAAALAVVSVVSVAACRVGGLPSVVGRDVRVPAVRPPSEGRATVVGALADSSTGDPVWGAAVYFTRDTVLGTGRATPRRDLPADTTRRDGGFALRDIPPGRYTLATDDLDHFPVRRVVILHAGQVDTVVLRPRRIGGR